MDTREPPHDDPETDADVRYLDLDHDGVPDAVERSHAIAFDSTGDGVDDAMEVVSETDSEIDIAGHPHHHAFRHARTDGFAVVRLRPRLLRDGLELLAEVGSDLTTVQVSVVGRGIHVESAAPEPTWRAFARLTTRLRRGSEASAVVPGDALARGLERASSVHARGIPFVVRPDGVWIGDHEIHGVPDVTMGEPPAPRPRTLARNVVVPRDRPADRECTFAVRRGSVTTTGALLGALERAGIPRVNVVEQEGRVRLVGRRRRRGRPDLSVLGPAKLHYE